MRVLVIDQIAPEGIQYLAERGFVSPEVIEEVEKAVDADFARIIRLAP